MQKLKELKMKENLLPKLGFGTASIALGSQMEAERTLKFALENGIRYFDTAPLYGGGQAEVRLGQALKDAPKNISVSTAFCRYHDIFWSIF
jgi:D-threo-aldose 1-dehydrogenase